VSKPRMTTRTREAYLMAAIAQVRPIFKAAGHPLPAVIRVSVGWGYATRGESKHILAQAWARCTSADDTNAVFISPRLSTADDALSALMHELAHVADDCEHGHGAQFKVIGEAIGLEGNATQMLPGIALSATLITIAEALGTYPHSELDPDATRAPADPSADPVKPPSKVHTGPARQVGSRHIKATCMYDQCAAIGYLMRVSRHWIEVAQPICPVCRTEMTVTY
jgi:hypothetical protein